MDKIEMPPLKVLFREAWEAFKGSLGNIFLLTLLGSVVGGVLVVAILFGIAGMGFLSVFEGLGVDKINSLQNVASFFTPERLSFFGISLLVMSILGGIIGSVVRLGIIKAVGDYKEKPKLGECLRTGFRFLIPVMVVSLVANLVVFGSWFLLIIPGIIIGLLFHFVIYEIVLGEKRWFKALVGSIQIMSQNFGEILLRFVVLFLGVAVVFQLPMYLLDTIVKMTVEKAPVEAASLMYILAWIKLVFGILLGFFGNAYAVIIYLHAKKATDESVKTNTLWIWIVSLLGWSLVMMLGGQFVKFIKNPVIQEKVKVAADGAKSAPLLELTEQEKIMKWQSAISSEARVYFDKSRELFKQMKEKSAKPTEVKKLNDENIAALKKALEIDKNNPEIWASLSDAYTWINSKGSLDDALAASEKAEEIDESIWSYTNRTGNILLMQGKNDEAILKYKQVIRMEDSYGRGHISLGIAYKRAGIKDLAKVEIQKGIDILEKYNQEGAYDVEILNARKEMTSL